MTDKISNILQNLLAACGQGSDKSGLITCTHDARLRLGQGRPGLAKIEPYPPRTRTQFWLKNRDSTTVLRRVTLTKLYRRAVSLNSELCAQIQLSLVSAHNEAVEEPGQITDKNIIRIWKSQYSVITL